MILGIIFGVLFLALIIWLGVKYLVLISSNKIAYNAFNTIHTGINKRYELIMDKLNSYNDNPNLVSETKNFINKALEFSLKKDGPDRIIRFANAIFDNAEKLALPLDDDKEFNTAKLHYNDCAKKLRHYVDVFPTSLMARLAGIKFIDSLK